MSIQASQIEGALHDLGQFLRSSSWYGRENELVNLFAHSFLIERGVHASRIGIEVAVKQLERTGGKALVRKDLVLWNNPQETVWTDGVASNDPAAVIEFKVNDNRKCRGDVEWLCGYTKLYPSVVGYSVCGFMSGLRGVSYSRIANGLLVHSACMPSDVLPRRVSTGKFESSPSI